MDLIESSQDIQNSLLELFRKKRRNCVPWKFKKDFSIPKSGEFLSPYEILIE